jgi:hypothetical protein
MKIKYVKLGRERAWGQADSAAGIIELDPRLKGKKHLEILIHEALHIIEPTWSETKVVNESKRLAKVIWSQNYRRSELK